MSTYDPFSGEMERPEDVLDPEELTDYNRRTRGRTRHHHGYSETTAEVSYEAWLDRIGEAS